MASPGYQGKPYGWFSGWHSSTWVFMTVCGHQEQSSGSGNCHSPTMPWLEFRVVITQGIPPNPCSSEERRTATCFIQKQVSVFSLDYIISFPPSPLPCYLLKVLNSLHARSYLVLTVALRSRYSWFSLLAAALSYKVAANPARMNAEAWPLGKSLG